MEQCQACGSEVCSWCGHCHAEADFKQCERPNCAVCKTPIPASDISAYRAEANGADDDGFPDVCMDCVDAIHVAERKKL